MPIDFPLVLLEKIQTKDFEVHTVSFEQATQAIGREQFSTFFKLSCELAMWVTKVIMTNKHCG